MNRRAPQTSIRNSRTGRLGFTLLELLVSLVILVIAMSIAVGAFSGTIHAWKRGGEVIDGIQHGDYAITQLNSVLNSILYFYNGSETYAFLIEKDSNYGHPCDIISFVTTSPAFLPANSPLISGPHRIELSIDDDEHGNPALYALATPPVANPGEYREECDEEPQLICRQISGLEILFWDSEEEEWIEEWEEENSVPERIQATIFVTSNDPDEDDMEFSRIIEIPVFDSVQQRLSGPSSSSSSNNRSR